MVDKRRIPYRKELPPKATKQLGGGGPRDMQRRQSAGMGSANIDMPKIDIEALKKVLLNNKEMREEFKAEIHKEMNEVKEVFNTAKNIEGIGLPFDVVERKIKEAVLQTEKSVCERYESGLGSLNNQLNVSKDQVKELNVRLSERKQELSILKKQLSERDIKLEERDVLINILREQQDQEIGDLKDKLDKLYDRISDGSIKPLVGSKMARPVLEDKIFIDPIEKSTEPKLDPHIGIEEDKTSKTDSDRDINTDLDKLRNLLKL